MRIIYTLEDNGNISMKRKDLTILLSKQKALEKELEFNKVLIEKLNTEINNLKRLNDDSLGIIFKLMEE